MVISERVRYVHARPELSFVEHEFHSALSGYEGKGAFKRGAILLNSSRNGGMDRV